MSEPFVEVPDLVLFDERLSDSAFRAYLLLAIHARDFFGTNVFEMTSSCLGTLLGRSATTAARYLAELEALGYISREKRVGAASLIGLTR